MERKFEYLTPAYFDELIYRMENTEGFIYIGVRDEEEWLREFRKHKPWISSIKLEKVPQTLNVYIPSADI